MGTNFYVITDVCNHCLRGSNKIHLGKQSAGWRFLFQANKEIWTDCKIENFEDVWKLITLETTLIQTEYNESVLPKQFKAWVDAAQKLKSNLNASNGCIYQDKDGYEFCAREFS